MRLPIRSITRLLIKAREKQEEDSMWDLYLSIYPKMNSETFITFEDFYDPARIVKDKSEKEILEEVKEVINSYNGGGNIGDI